MKLTTLILVLTLTGCASYPMLIPPSPAHCRANGVLVDDLDTPTGEIVSWRYGRTQDVLAHCRGQSSTGCAVKVAPHRYSVMVHTDASYQVETEEACHSLYEEPRHVDLWLAD